MTAVFVGLFQVDLLHLTLVGLHKHFLPSDMNGIFARELVKDSVATNDNEIMIFLDFKGGHVWVSDDDIGVAFVLFDFGFNVADGPRD